jgi:hypothetical protein
MARKINPSEEERAALRQKNLSRRSELYSVNPPKFKIEKNDMEEAEAPLSQVSSIIDRFKDQNSTARNKANGFDHLYNEDKLKKLDGVTGNVSETSSDDSTDNALETGHVFDNSSANNQSVQVPETNNNVSATRSDSDTSIDPNLSNLVNNNKITRFEPDYIQEAASVNATDSSLDTGYVSATSENATSIHPIQKYLLIQAIYTEDKDLSNVEKNFLVSLIIEMNHLSERISLNSFITKYEFRRATVYQIIPRICNLGFVQIISDNSPKGSQIDLTILFKRYGISTSIDNVISNDKYIVRNFINKNTNITKDEADTEIVTSEQRLDATKRILIKNSVLFLFRSMMLLESYRRIDQYNEKSIKLFSNYLLENNVSEDSQFDLLGLAIYSAEKAKNPDRVIYYLHSSLENGGIESLQISFKDKARELLEQSNIFFDTDLEEPSLREIREFSISYGLDASQSRQILVDQLNQIKTNIDSNIERLEQIIEAMPEFRKQ